MNTASIEVATYFQWILFWFLLKGGRDYVTPLQGYIYLVYSQLGDYIMWLYTTNHPLQARTRIIHQLRLLFIVVQDIGNRPSTWFLHYFWAWWLKLASIEEEKEYLGTWKESSLP